MVIDNVPNLPKVNGIDDLVVAILLVTIQILSLATVA